MQSLPQTRAFLPILNQVMAQDFSCTNKIKINDIYYDARDLTDADIANHTRALLNFCREKYDRFCELIAAVDEPAFKTAFESARDEMRSHIMRGPSV